MLTYRAFRHKITKHQVEEVLANKWGMSKWFAIHDDHLSNSQDMVVGFDSKDTMVEIGITYVEDDEIIFHAKKVTFSWRRKYNEK